MDEISLAWLFVVRRVRNKPSFFHDDGTLSSALFKDSKGVSTDKDHMRSIDEVIVDEERLHELYYPIEKQQEQPEYKLSALVSIDKEVCEEKKIKIIDDPIPEINPHHCLLFKNEKMEGLSQSQARALSSSAKIIKKYNLL